MTVQRGPINEVCKETLVIINGFVHDMSTGIWIGALVLMRYTLSRGLSYGQAVVEEFALGLMQGLWLLSLASFVIMLLTGIMRVFTLKYYGWSGDIARGRKRLLMIKHILLGILVSVGLYLQVRIYLAVGGG